MGHAKHMPLPKRLAITAGAWTAYTSIIVGLGWLLALPALAITGILVAKGMLTTSTYSFLHVQSRKKSHPDHRPSHREFACVMAMLVTFIVTAGWVITSIGG